MGDHLQAGRGPWACRRIINHTYRRSYKVVLWANAVYKPRSMGRGGILGVRPAELHRSFLADCEAVGMDLSAIADPLATDRLMARWYSSLESGTPDFGVYDGDDYMADLWDCWKTYSRKYLRSLRAPGVMPSGASFVDSYSLDRIVDLGCGIGYSTAALCQLFPNAEVIGTNLPGTKQMKLLQRNARQYGFHVETSLERVGPVDLVFASEYFEHHREPVSHLDDVMICLEPSMMLIANTFTSPSVGHFPSYCIDGGTFSGRATSRMFNTGLRAHGMTRVPLKVWNGRPSLWARG